MAKTRTRSSFRPKLISIAVASCFVAGTALANPTGPAVMHGTAAIHRAGNLLQITNSPNAIINWQSFSIGANEITRFLQQSQASAVLNRVTGAGGRIDPSVILGTLQSNGRVFLINPNGILFGAGAKVDVAGLVASSLNLSNEDFLAGRLRFTEVPGAGAVINQGSITTGAGGSVYLVGSAVTNSGVITSPQGEVILAAGNSVELVDPGTPNLRVEIAAADHEARNLGAIISDAGRVGIYAGLINHSGTIRADSAFAEGGRIVLKATKDTILEAGSVTSANGVNGGTVQVLGNRVGLLGDASINASGEAGGGTVLVGGDFQGKNPDVQNAFRTYFGPEATINADALTSGDGGRVVVWSDDATRAYGTITARGGAESGNGGFVEVSGKKWLDFDATVDTRAPNGASGTLLLDPTSIWIAASLPVAIAAGMTSSDTSVDIAPEPFFQTSASGVTESLLRTGTLEVALATNGFVTVSTFNQFALGVGDINVVSNVGWGSGTLQLNAENKINLGAQLTGPNGALFLSANNGITQTAAGRIMTDQLYANGGSGTVRLHLADNRVNLLTGQATEEFRFKNAQLLEIGTIISAESSGISVSGSNSATVDVQVTKGDLTVNNDVRAGTGSSNQARITLSAQNNLIVNNSTIISLAGAGEVSSADAQVTLTAQTGDITLNSSTVEARSIRPGCCNPSLDSAVTMTAGGNITLSTSNVIVEGGGGDTGEAGGMAAATLMAGKSIQLTGQSNISVTGGDGGAGFTNGRNGGDGGVATVTLTASSISLTNSSSISASGGAGGSGGGVTGGSGGNGGNGGNALVSLKGGSISIDGSSVNAAGGGGESGGSGSGSGAAAGLGGRGGSATVNLSGSSISLVSSNVNADGGDAGDGGQGIEGAAGGLGGNGGNARVTLVGGSVSLTGSGITVNGGQGGDGGSASSGGAGAQGGIGGTATVTLTGSSISLAGGSSINASGGDGEDGGDNTFGGGVAGKGGNGGTATVTLTGGSISLSSANIQTDGGSGGRGGSVSGSSGGIGANGGKGANASVMLNGGSITVNSASVFAGGGGSGSGGFGPTASGAPGAGGAASVIVTANAGNVTVQGFSTIRADGAGGGTSVVNLVAPGDITVTSSRIDAGDTCCDFSPTNGGTSAIGLAAGGNITVDGGEGLFANGGDGQVNGGVAAITLAANGGITVNQASVQARGGSGSSGNGGDAAVTFTANGGSILVQNTPFTISAFGGEGPITGGSAAITMVAASGITIDGSTVNATAYPFNCDCNPPQNGGLGLVSLNANTGTINLLNGSVVEANGGGGTVNSGSGQINLAFSGRTSGGYFIDGVEGLIVDDLSLPTTGFFVNFEPAILDTNLFVTYLGNQPVFNDILVATMNQQADVLADQLRAGEVGEEEEKKKLPFCD